MKISALSATLCVAVWPDPRSAGHRMTQLLRRARSLLTLVKAGADSHADKIAPPGAVNQGAFNMEKWKYGHAFDALPNTQIWKIP